MPGLEDIRGGSGSDYRDKQQAGGRVEGLALLLEAFCAKLWNFRLELESLVGYGVCVC